MDNEFEPMVAHGARMSWTGILRPGDAFPRSVASRRALMTASSGDVLTRYFGQWSQRYHRYTTNLTSSRITVRVLAPEEEDPRTGIQCILQWVPRSALLATGAGSVCRGDGWPVGLWRRLVELLRARGQQSVAEGLREIAWEPTSDADDRLVAAWRTAVTRGRVHMPLVRYPWRNRWLPVAADLLTERGTTACIVSWSPTAPYFHSLSQAITAGSTAGRQIDPNSQAAYYLECTLATLHGLRFGPDDAIVDTRYDSTPEVRGLLPRYHRREQEYIAEGAFGNLSWRGQR